MTINHKVLYIYGIFQKKKIMPSFRRISFFRCDVFTWLLTTEQSGKCLIKVNIMFFLNRRSRGIEAGPTQTRFFGDDRKAAALAPPKRAVLKALKMSVIHVAFFILSWTPYTVIGTWWLLSSIKFILVWWLTLYYHWPLLKDMSSKRVSYSFQGHHR